MVIQIVDMVPSLPVTCGVPSGGVGSPPFLPPESSFDEEGKGEGETVGKTVMVIDVNVVGRMGARKLCSPRVGVTGTVWVLVAVAITGEATDTETVSVAIIVLVVLINADGGERGPAGMAREMLTAGVGVLLAAAASSKESYGWWTMKYTPTPRPIAAILIVAAVRQMSQRRVLVADVQNTIFALVLEF